MNWLATDFVADVADGLLVGQEAIALKQLYSYCRTNYNQNSDRGTVGVLKLGFLQIH